MMNIKKRGIFFTFMAIMMMALFILIFTPSADISLQKNTRAVTARINVVNNYADSLENSYLKTVLRASSYKTILSFIFYMNQTKSYLANFDAAFFEVISNGTINGVDIDSITEKNIMAGSTLMNWSNKITNISSDTLNVNTTIIIINASVSQTNPWEINTKLAVNYTVKSDLAEWKKSAVITSSFSIEGLYDPYYFVNTNGKYSNQIKRSGVQFDKWNISHTREHLRNGTYVHWENSDAPSFLMRFTNAIQPSDCCGIESLVNPNNLDSKDMTDSYVDYLFWTNTYRTRCSELYNVTHPPESKGLWDEFEFFKLDFDHLTRYNITEQDAVKDCR